MRCYFVRAGHIAAVEMLTGLSDKDAIAKAHSLFSERKTQFDGFEVWDQTRFLFRHPDPDAAEPKPPPASE
jgi:hypothetical protein